jgi:hypothetical protein
MVRTTVGTIAEAELSVQQTEDVATVDGTQTTTVPAGSTEITDVNAPSGTLINVSNLDILVQPPSGASSGSHRIVVQGPDGSTRYILAQSSFDTQIRLFGNTITTGDDTQTPGTAATQQANILALAMDDTNSIKLRYDNFTDVDQTNDRRVKIVGIQRGVTS